MPELFPGYRSGGGRGGNASSSAGYGRVAGGELPYANGSALLSGLECVGDEESGSNWRLAE